MATCIHSSWSCLPPFYTIPIFPLLNLKIFHLLVIIDLATCNIILYAYIHMYMYNIYIIVSFVYFVTNVTFCFTRDVTRLWPATPLDGQTNLPSDV